MHCFLSLPSAVTCLTLAITVVGRPAFDVMETGNELIGRANNSLGSTCDLDLTDPNAAWAKSKAPQFLDSLMYSRGSGKMGSIQALDKVVDKEATGQPNSNVDCTDFGNTANCPLPSSQDCEDTTKFSSPVWYWIEVAFHNFNGYNSAMHDAAGWEAVQNSLDIAGIASDVTGSWNTDTVDTNTLYNHLGAGFAIGGSITGNIPGIGPYLSLAAAVVGAFTSMEDQQQATDFANEQANAAKLQANAVEELSARVQSVMTSSQQSFVDMSNWMFATGADWPNQSPPSPQFDDDEMYLSTQIFGEGAYLNPTSTDTIQKIQNQMVANMRKSLFGLALKANDIWATWVPASEVSTTDQNSLNFNCMYGWTDGTGNCWTITAYPPPPGSPKQIETLFTVVSPTGQGDSSDGFLPKYDINPWQFFANILDCATNPTGDGQVDTSSTTGPWPDSQGGLPKCFYSIGVTKGGGSSAGLNLPPDGSATKGPTETCPGCSSTDYE